MATDVGKLVNLHEEIPEEVWCRYCNGVYKSPLLLPCLHSFCKTCLEDIRKSQQGRLTCLVCLTDVECDFECLLPNTLAQRRVEELEKEKSSKQKEPCGGCESRPKNAQSRCTECEEYLCDECIQAHRRVRFTKDHEILSFQEILDRELKLKKETTGLSCLIHRNEALDRFCVTCDVAICKECQRSIHSDGSKHKHSSMRDVFDSSKSSLGESLNKTRERIPELQKAVYEIIKTYGRVQNRVEEITWQIRKTSRHLIQAIKDREHQLIKELHDVQERRCDVLIGEKEAMEKKLVQTIDGCDFADDILRQDRQNEILTFKKIISERLENLRVEKAEVKPEKMRITFEPNEEPIVRTIKDAFGSLQIEFAPPAKNTMTSSSNDKTANADKRSEPLDESEGSSSARFKRAVSEPVLDTIVEKEDTKEKKNKRRFSLPPVIGKKGAKAVSTARNATTFTVTTMDHKSKRKEVQVQLETPNNSVISAHVLDNKDGTYTVFYCPKTPGEHTVFVSLSSKNIKHGNRILNIRGSFQGMREEELALACKVLCLIRWQITPGMLQKKHDKVVPNPKVTFKELKNPVGDSNA